MFSEGDYVAYLITNGVSVIGGNTLTADHMTVYDYNDVDDYAGQLQGTLVSGSMIQVLRIRPLAEIYSAMI
ncbi:hypothetical protein AMD27_06135 [Acinetobacter sp. TGL-Y2]|uniref:hypothetical protein n=1 Tax=Acinetobacter sp. TGL-Y2 TaxID=1407071 RepID=UPI0007A6754E|nr:hypothetical protein [Acinetobacter sp. TGL-Y2]AMW78506.1 hypothetical protein AMD27_06135 [Acinetobacter sp. TGL-Y2]